MSAGKVLVIDDDDGMLELVRDVLGGDGWDVSVAPDGPRGIASLERESPDVVLLDLKLPGLDGFETCRRMRELSTVPIVALSALDSVRDKERFLSLGGDDYVTKPFSVHELLFRVRKSARRDTQEGPALVPQGYDHGHLAIDFGARRVTVDATEVPITGREYHLLRELCLHEGSACSAADLLRDVWGPAYVTDISLLYVAIAHLRSKIEPDPSHPCYIITIPRFGYRFQCPLPK